MPRTTDAIAITVVDADDDAKHGQGRSTLGDAQRVIRQRDVLDEVLDALANSSEQAPHSHSIPIPILSPPSSR
jgi:hypothetical protein